MKGLFFSSLSLSSLKYSPSRASSHLPHRHYCKLKISFPNMTLCASATGSPCDASAVREDTAPAGLTRSSGFLRDLLSCNDTDKSATNPPPQTPRPLIKVIRTRLAVVNRGQLLAAAETSLLVRLVGGGGFGFFQTICRQTSPQTLWVSQTWNQRLGFQDDLWR